MAERDRPHILVPTPPASESFTPITTPVTSRGNDELKDTVEKTLLEMADDGTFMEIAEKYADYGLVDSVCLGK